MAIKRWTDEMLDELASSVSDQKESIIEVKESIIEVKESISEIKDSIDGLRVTSQALLQIAAQNQQRMDHFEEEMEKYRQRQAESDHRFNVLLEEVRFLIRGKKED